MDYINFDFESDSIEDNGWCSLLNIEVKFTKGKIEGLLIFKKDKDGNLAESIDQKLIVPYEMTRIQDKARYEVDMFEQNEVGGPHDDHWFEQAREMALLQQDDETKS